MTEREVVNTQIEDININVEININLLDFSWFSFSLIDIGFYIYIIPFFSLELVNIPGFVVKKLSKKSRCKSRRMRRWVVLPRPWKIEPVASVEEAARQGQRRLAKDLKILRRQTLVPDTLTRIGE